MKFVREHCSICDKDMDMPVVQEDESRPGLIWVQCPQCREIKPLEAGSALEKNKSPAVAPEAGAGPGGPKETGPARGKVVRNYRAGERFSTGEWIYHPGWNDTGQVIEKCRSKGGNEIIVVEFQRMGARRLVNNFAS